MVNQINQLDIWFMMATLGLALLSTGLVSLFIISKEKEDHEKQLAQQARQRQN